MACPFSKNNAWSIVFFACIALVLGVGLHVWNTHKPRMTQPTSATPLNQPQGLPAFSLIDSSNLPFTNRSLIGHYSFLFFGYTHCQGICPITMTLLTQLYAQLEKQKLPLPQIVFITLDPRRDTKNVLAHYVHAFHSSFQGVTGSSRDIQQLSKQMGVVYISAQQKKESNYQIDHSGTLYLIDPEGKLIAVFSPPHDKNAIAKDYRSLTQS